MLLCKEVCSSSNFLNLMTVLQGLTFIIFMSTFIDTSVFMDIVFPVIFLKVQEKHHLCHERYTYPRCSCAVAVRSGKDVFMVDICNSKSIIHFPSCGDRVLKVIKTNDRYYKVFLKYMKKKSIILQLMYSLFLT